MERDQEVLGRVRDRLKYRIEYKERLALRNKAERLEIYGGLREDIGIQTYLHGPMEYTKNLKLRSRVGKLDLPKRRDIPVVGRRRTWRHMCACVAQQWRVGLAW